METGKRPVAPRRKLESLPSLGPTSAAVLLGLYCMVFGLLVLLVELGKLTTQTGLYSMLGFIALQFIVGPWILDFSLRALGSLRWTKYEELPPHLAAFIKEVCFKQGIKNPRVGLIEDGAPNAFTYGNTHRNARLVLTKGILNLLDEKEVRAVVAHELGHITHSDFIFMTVAQVVPVLLYTVYRILNGSSKGGNNKDRGALAYAAIVAYVFYLISQYVVLFLSRLREYWADRFSVEVTRDPKSMITALIKIAYGLAAQTEAPDAGLSPKDQKKKKASFADRFRRWKAVGAFGVADSTKPGAFGLYAASSGGMPPASAMTWDLANPWARFYELHSTHPMTAKRIRAIAHQAEAMGIALDMPFPKVQPLGWGRFLMEVFILFLPWTLGVGLVALSTLSGRASFPFFFAGLAMGHLIKLLFAYPSGPFRKAKVADLLKETEVSPIHAIPVVVSGKIIGRGVPGYIFSEDFVMQDETGFVFLDYESPIPGFNFFFSLLRSGKFLGQNVVVEGWYRRKPMPFVEIRRLRSETAGVARCWRRTAALVTWSLVLVGCLASQFLGIF